MKTEMTIIVSYVDKKSFLSFSIASQGILGSSDDEKGVEKPVRNISTMKSSVCKEESELESRDSHT